MRDGVLHRGVVQHRVHPQWPVPACGVCERRALSAAAEDRQQEVGVPCLHDTGQACSAQW